MQDLHYNRPYSDEEASTGHCPHVGPESLILPCEHILCLEESVFAVSHRHIPTPEHLVSSKAAISVKALALHNLDDRC